jgi:hypothetical protein
MFFRKFFPPVIEDIELITIVSNQFNVKLAKVGLITPPCGVPSSVFMKSFESTAPALSHPLRINLCDLNSGIFVNNQL